MRPSPHGQGTGLPDTCPSMMNEPGQEGWTLERARWEELQSLVDLLNQAVEVTPDWGRIARAPS